ncbi:hypothetical protein E0H77_01220 [Acinetobacter sp. ANC 4633]|uniref:hypothetical protein n=1 Tax=Acinetobacter sp. ANC 4633 TaxID=2529845 RepID=UPI0010390262|nr:hypothetical protein [Acinetobacter sp. ANC 4633]TCB28797.1 hypothetical protein E0H77_01220 [Acinetobacter sp. ANC 4633]
MQPLQFSLKANQIEILWNSQQFILPQGLDAIQQQSLVQGVWSEFAIEKMIYLIEELLESEPQLRHVQGRAITSDPMMKLLNQLFFKTSGSIDRVQLEHAFNDFIEHIGYYLRQVAEDQQQAFVYFVMIREMMHHLNIQEILIK